MKKLILIILLVLPVFAQSQGIRRGQVGMTGITPTKSIGTGGIDQSDNLPSYDGLTIAYFDRLDSLGITYTQDLKAEFDEYFFGYFRPYGILDSMVAVYWVATDSSLGLTDTTRVKQNLLNNKYTLIGKGTNVWRLGLDVGGNGSNSYISTDFNPIVSGDTSIYKRFSSGIYIYQTSYHSGNCFYYSSFQYQMATYTYSAAGVLYLNQNSYTEPSRVDTNRVVAHTLMRYSYTVLTYYRNGLPIQTFANNAGTMANTTIDWFCLNNGGSRGSFNTSKIRVFAILGGLSAWGVNIFNTGIERWANHKGIGVQ